MICRKVRVGIIGENQKRSLSVAGERNEQGQIAALLALIMTLLLVFGAFAVDMSNALQLRGLSENAADAGTLAAASAYRASWTSSSLPTTDPTRVANARSAAFSAAHRYLLVNSSFTAAQLASCVDPTIEADHAQAVAQRTYTAVSPTEPNCVAVNDRSPEQAEFRVWVPGSVGGTYSRVFRDSPLRANGASQLALKMNTQPVQALCGIYALANASRTGQGAATFDLNGIGVWNVSGCVHSNGDTLIQNPSQLTKPRVQSVGTIQCTATVGLVCPPPHINGSVNPGIPPISDPLRHLPDPPAAAAPISFDSELATCACSMLSPGTYTGPYNTLGNGATVYLRPGNYIFVNDGQPFNVGGRLLLDPAAGPNEGVTLFFMGGGEKLIVRNAGVINLRAQRTGPYANVLIYYDRTAVGQLGLRVNPGAGLQGTVYLPNGELRFDVQTTGWSTTSRFIAATISNQQTAFTINIDESTNAQLIF